MMRYAEHSASLHNNFGEWAPNQGLTMMAVSIMLHSAWQAACCMDAAMLSVSRQHASTALPHTSPRAIISPAKNWGSLSGLVAIG